jgi:hypothetical protein
LYGNARAFSLGAPPREASNRIQHRNSRLVSSAALVAFECVTLASDFRQVTAARGDKTENIRKYAGREQVVDYAVDSADGGDPIYPSRP